MVIANMLDKRLQKVLNNNKGSTVLELFFTYGWALIAVSLAIAALHYGGVLNLQTIMPNSCIVPQGISCLDYKASPTSIEVTLKNSMGYDLSAITVVATACGSSTTASLAAGQQTKFTINCGPILTGHKYTGQLNVSYAKTDSGIIHKSFGKITTAIN